MSGWISLFVQRLRHATLGPVGLALIAWMVLAAVSLPTVDTVALSAGGRAVADLGLLGLRVALWVAAAALGTDAVGPPMRHGEVDLWRVRGLTTGAWLWTRVLGALLPLTAALGCGVLCWMGLNAALGHEVPAGLPAWTVLSTVELFVVFGAFTLCGTAVRGSVGPVVAIVWLLLGRLHGAMQGADGLPGVIGSVLGWLVPHTAALDGQAALVGADPSPNLLAASVHGAAWVGATLLLTLMLARRLARR